jgi:hypothetical protein
MVVSILILISKFESILSSVINAIGLKNALSGSSLNGAVMAFIKHRHQGAYLSLADIIFIVEDFLC